MRKIISIFFLTSYLFSATEAQQLLKLPIVFEHYQEHIQDKPDLGFMKFLEIHYMHGSPRDADYNRDMQLPFKTAGECIPSLVTGYVPLLVQYALTPPSVLPVKKNYYTKELFPPSFYISNIWQPPKSC